MVPGTLDVVIVSDGVQLEVLVDVGVPAGGDVRATYELHIESSDVCNELSMGYVSQYT